MEQTNGNNAVDRANRTGYWPLRTDSRDRTAHGRHGEDEAVRYEDAALFDGESSTIVFPGLDETDGSRPFTLTVEVRIEDGGGRLPGGICSRYSPADREGWHLSALTQAGVTSSQPNWRNLQFGWSRSAPEDRWRDWGSPGGSRCISAMCVHAGDLYVGTFDDARDRRGHVFRLEAGGEWTDCGHPDESNSVFALAEYKGRLYAGTMRYKAGGSRLPESLNREPGGGVYRYDGDRTWTLLGKLPVPDSDSVGALAVFGDKLIAMSFYPYGVFAYDEDGSCTDLGAPGPAGTTRTHTLAAFRGRLYIGCNEAAGVYSRTLDGPWEYCGTAPLCDQVYSFTVYHNELLMGIWREARMLRYAGGTTWTDAGMMGEELEVMGVSVFNGHLYGGTLPGGYVYRYRGGTEWERIGVLEEPNAEIDYRRVWTMAVHRGRLFAGTLPGGKVWSLENDPLATGDETLGDGWHKVAVTFDSGKLALYVDGKPVSQAEDVSQGGLTPLQAAVPFMLGRGPQSVFSGRLRELELYDRALTAEEIAGACGV